MMTGIGIDVSCRFYQYLCILMFTVPAHGTPGNHYFYLHVVTLAILFISVVNCHTKKLQKSQKNVYIDMLHISVTASWMTTFLGQ